MTNEEPKHPLHQWADRCRAGIREIENAKNTLRDLGTPPLDSKVTPEAIAALGRLYAELRQDHHEVSGSVRRLEFAGNDIAESAPRMLSDAIHGMLSALNRISQSGSVPADLPEQDWYRAGQRRLIILGPMGPSRRPLPCYPVKWSVSFTGKLRGPQRELERQAAQREAEQRAMAEAARRNDPAWQMQQLQERVAKLEQENAGLKARIENSETQPKSATNANDHGA